ncbi:MAG: hypothetical protein KIT68_00680 [Phycisphaeraceae bacterium]|nr:hypothetical protein [Phycisphaeraceae bacterium]
MTMSAFEAPAITGAALGAADRTVHAWGPAALRAHWSDPALARALARHSNQYDAPWRAGPGEPRCWTLDVGCVKRERGEVVAPTGGFLTTVHLDVRRAAPGIVESRGRRGTMLRIDEPAQAASLAVPPWRDRPDVIEEAEQQLTLLSARAWALAGWTPVHGATVVHPRLDRCAVLCAPSGSGKTTLTFSLLRRGWRTLGDDKLLARRAPGGVEARAVARRMHLDPAASRWLAEAGDIRRFPTYSPWTDKRHVDLEGVWPGRLVTSAVVCLVVRVRREAEGAGLRWAPLELAQRIDVLGRQVAIPGEAAAARPLVATIGAMGAAARGLDLSVGPDAFGDSAGVDRFSDALMAELSEDRA